MCDLLIKPTIWIEVVVSLYQKLINVHIFLCGLSYKVNWGCEKIQYGEAMRNFHKNIIYTSICNLYALRVAGFSIIQCINIIFYRKYHQYSVA